MKRNIVYLPKDVLVEILSRVPEASLARLRSTSKEWNALIKKDARLDKKSLAIILIDCRVYLARLDLHDNNLVKVISQLRLTDPLSSSSEEVDVRRVCHCDGLLLCTTMDERLVVWNPCSVETSRIIKPLNSKYSSHTYALGKSSCNNEYKILRVYHLGDGWMSACLVEYEIYDLTSNSWRAVGEARGWTFPRNWRHGTSADGNTYYSFLLILVKIVKDREIPYDILIIRQRDVWIATKIKGTGDMSWSKLLSVKRTSRDQFFRLCNGMSFLADREHKVILHPIKYKDSSKFLHIVGEDKYIKVDLHDVGSKYPLPVSCVPTLVQIQQGSLGLGTWKAPITKFS
ncbi:hypothetical protein Bca4012_073378 [Brassica carinata]